MISGRCWALLSVLFVTRVEVSAENGSNNKNNNIINNPFLLTGEDVSRGALAVELAWIVNNNDDDNNDDEGEPSVNAPPGGICLKSGTDAVYLARVGDSYCAASFMGTQSFQATDWWTNIELDPVVFGSSKTNNNNNESSSSSRTDKSCDVHGGYHDAYASFDHRDTVERFLKDCRAACETCEIVLTGHSQGGAIAAVAALYLTHQLHNNSDIGDIGDNEAIDALSGTDSGANANANANATTTTQAQAQAQAQAPKNSNHHHHIPYVITFGAPPSLGSGCESYFSETERRRWFRYIMSAESQIGRTKLVYDPIPLVYSRLLDHQWEQDGEVDTSSSNNNTNTENEIELESWFDEGLFGIRLPTDETYARNGGLAYIGYEILLSAEDPSSVLLTGFDAHRFVDPSYMDVSGRAHQDYVYLEVLRAQNDLYRQHQHQHTQERPPQSHESGKEAVGVGLEHEDATSSGNPTESTAAEWFLPTGGFAEGSLCNPDETSSSPIATTTTTTTTCAAGLACDKLEEDDEEKGWWSRWFGKTASYNCVPRAAQAQAPPSPGTTVAGPRDAGGSGWGDEIASREAQYDDDAQAVVAAAATTDAAFSSAAATTTTNRSGSLTAFGAAMLSVIVSWS